MNIRQLKLKLYKQKKGKKTVFQKYKTFCYKLVGKYFENKSEQYDSLREKLIQADMHLTPGVYFSLIIITAILTCIFTFIFASIGFNSILQNQNWLLYSLALSGLIASVTIFFFPFIVSNRTSNRRAYIEQDISFILSELSILATTGMSPIRIFRNMSKRHIGTPINSEFKKIIYKVDIDGKDIITALSETAKETPSPTFREMIWDLANMIHQGGELDVYLRNKADTTMQLKRDTQKQFVDKISVYLEVYISLFLIGIVLLAIAVFLLDILGQNMGGFTPEIVLMLMAFGLIPVITLVINILVNMVYTRNG